jgi:transcriptional regulator with XRE-family HTH domain
MFDPNDLAAYIRNRRKYYGLSQAALAEQAQVAPAQVRRLESARGLPLDAAIRILRVLDPQKSAPTL